MTCNEFLSHFSDYRDGLLTAEARERAEAHLEDCASCRRYRRVVERGIDLLSSREPIPVPDDFRPRLKHRIYHEEDGDVLASGSSASGASLAAALGMAILLTAAAWSPAMRSAQPEVRLPAIVVSQPPRRAPELSVPPARFFGDAVFRARSAPTGSPGLWAAPRSLLYEYSPLQRRYPATSAVRADLD